MAYVSVATPPEQQPAPLARDDVATNGTVNGDNKDVTTSVTASSNGTNGTRSSGAAAAAADQATAAIATEPGTATETATATPAAHTGDPRVAGGGGGSEVTPDPDGKWNRRKSRQRSLFAPPMTFPPLLVQRQASQYTTGAGSNGTSGGGEGGAGTQLSNGSATVTASVSAMAAARALADAAAMGSAAADALPGSALAMAEDEGPAQFRGFFNLTSVLNDPRVSVSVCVVCARSPPSHSSHTACLATAT